MSVEADLAAAAEEEIERAGAFRWAQLIRHMPWGDTFEGFTPAGRPACFERNYIWETDPGGDIRVEVTVYEPHAYEKGVRLTRAIPRERSSG